VGLKLKLKFKVILPIILLSLSLIALVENPPQSSNDSSDASTNYFKGNVGNVTLILNCSYPKVPGKIPVLKIVEKNITVEEVLIIAEEIFNFTGEVSPLSFAAEEVLAYRVRNNSQKLKELIVYRCGAIEYFEGSDRTGESIIPTLNIPSRQRCREIANKFLEKLANYGLTPRNPLMEIKYVYDHAGMTSSIGFIEWVEYWNVYYEIRFNGTLLCGDAGVIISIGDKGRIVEFHGDWREVELGELVEITVTPEQAFKSLATKHGLKSKPTKIIVNDIELAYWADFTVEKHIRLIPVYFFKCVAIYDDGEDFIFEQYLPATNLTSERLEYFEQFHDIGSSIFSPLRYNNLYSVKPADFVAWKETLNRHGF